MDSSSDYELFNPPERDGDPHIYRVIGRDFVVRMPDSDTDWQMGPIQKEKYRTYGESLSVEDLTVLCIATQVWGPSVGRKAVMKLKIQTSQWSKDVSHVGDSPITREIEQEINVKLAWIWRTKVVKIRTGRRDPSRCKRVNV